MLALLLLEVAELRATQASDLPPLLSSSFPDVTSFLNKMPPYPCRTRTHASDGTTIQRNNSQAFNTHLEHAQHYFEPRPIITIFRNFFASTHMFAGFIELKLRIIETLCVGRQTIFYVLHHERGP